MAQIMLIAIDHRESMPSIGQTIKDDRDIFTGGQGFQPERLPGAI